ncbi:MAG: hypothetical protein AAF125_13230, partial [Chloroflexota bacterium]
MVLKSIKNFILGEPAERTLRQYSDAVDAVNALEPEIKALSDAELRAKTDEFRDRIKDGALLDDLM